ncbi:MAG: hypothetical protein SF051_14145, partial [Elusimicrobiota bacterium]|nr:hypothetical protein [Elusimicrobiota bacterium]
MKHLILAVSAATILSMAVPASAGFVPGAARAVNAAHVTVGRLPGPWQSTIGSYLSSPSATRADLTVGLRSAALAAPLDRRVPSHIAGFDRPALGTPKGVAAAPASIAPGAAAGVMLAAGVEEALQAFAASAADPVTAARKLTELEQVLSAYPGVTIKEL